MLVIFLGVNNSYSQAGCDCDPVTEVNVCYLDRDTYCDPLDFGNCGITLNHELQSEGIVQKLTSENNFGPNGIVDCKINIIPIDTLESINDVKINDCHVFYVGAFPGRDSNGSLDFDATALSDNILSIIYNWSIECSRNLVIVPQVEANIWGYAIEDANINPNSPVLGSNPFFSIFDGPFGVAQSFNQGGTYQGVITETPATGHTVLALDAEGKPTIALDFVSNDLIIGDIGFFSVPLAGDLTEGGFVDSNNDILACNIFAFACQLVDEYIFDNVNVQLCNGDSYQLPSGEVVQNAGNYLDTISIPFECDTIINTQINIELPESEVLHTGCKGDGYSIQVGPTIYNEQNPNGEVVLTSSLGCDSTVFIDLMYADTSSFFFTEQLCVEDDMTFIINGTLYGYNNQQGEESLINQYGCDSTVIINLEYILEDSYELIENAICENSTEIIVVNERIYDASNPSGVEVLQNVLGCDSVVEVNLEILRTSSFNYILELCSNSDSMVTINGSIYNLDSPVGQELFTNVVGCDSTVNINIVPVSTSTSTIDTSLCINDDFQFVINNTIYDLSNPKGEEVLLNRLGCDSVVSIDIQSIDLDTHMVDIDLCPDVEYIFGEEVYGIGDIFYQHIPRSAMCDSLIVYTIYEKEDINEDYETTLFIDSDQVDPLNLGLTNVQSALWSPEQGLSCINCINPILNSTNGLNFYQVTVTDEALCTYIIDVNVEYIDDLDLPNIFSPNGDFLNDEFILFLPLSQYEYDVEIQELRIFDRWGNLVQYLQNDILTDKYVLWDGMINGVYGQNGVYVYQFDLKYPNNSIRRYRGDITLYR